MDKNISNEKKPLRLKVKTFVDLRRFTSKQLHKIVENFRTKNRAYEAKYKEMSALDYMKVVKRNELLAYKVRNSLVELSDKQTEKSRNKILEERKEFIQDAKAYNANVKDGKYNEKEQKKIKNEFEDRAYKINKEMYARNLGRKDQERPQNPKIQRAINNVKNAAKTVGKGIATGASMVAGAVAFPFVMSYKGAKAVGRGIEKGAKKIGRGANVALLTAGKVKEQVQTLKTQAERDLFEKSSEKAQDEIIASSHAKALKENAKRDREAQRRENLHMDREEQPINHKEAIEKVDGEVLTQEEVKKVYGDQEK